MAVRARAVRKLGALALTDHPRPVEASEETARALAEGIARAGFEHLPWSGCDAPMARPRSFHAPR